VSAHPPPTAPPTADPDTLPFDDAVVRAIVDSVPQLVWSTTPDGYHDYYNAQWYEYTGMPREGAQGWNWKNFLHPDDYDRAVEVWGRSLASGAPYEIEYRFKRAADGMYRWFLGRANPLRDADGRILRWFGTCTDIDDHRRREVVLAFLAEAGAALASSLDVDRTLATAARLAVPRLADWCAIDLLDDDGLLRRVAVEHVDPEKVALARGLHERYPPRPEEEHGVMQVLRTGEPELVADIPESLLAAVARDAEHLRLARALGLCSYIVAPIRVQGRTIGAITLVSAESRRRFGAEDLATAVEFARRASTAMDNAQLHQESVRTQERLEQQAAELELQNEQLQEQSVELEMQAAQLQEQAADLAAANDRLVATNASEQAARAEAEQANRAKAEFLATMSHELRTPLNAIAGYTDLLSMGVRGPVGEPVLEDLRRIKRSAQHLLSLINDILNFARLEAGQVELHIARVAMPEVLAGVEALVGPQVRERGLTYAFACGDGVAARADAEKVRQVLLNLLTNAVKFTEPGGRIDVACGARDGRVWVEVRDTGRGIPGDRLDTVFEPFVQVDRHLTHDSQQGVGLGLAISRDLARAMGGDLTAESAVGVGSTFVLTLPAE
jgi:PAS domain S-box-containing protein